MSAPPGITCSGRTVLVTGAGSGLGRAMVLALAAADAYVVAAVRRPATGREVIDEIVAAGGTGTWIECDVTRRTDVEAAVQVAVERTGGLDVMVHNATSDRSAEQRPLEELDDEHWEALASTNLRAAFWCAQASYPHLRARRGTLILLTSGAGIDGAPRLGGYAACKAGIRTLTKSLAAEWGPDGVTVNCVAPAALTRSYQQILDDTPAWREHIATSTPLGRLGDPLDDIAPTVVFLASAAARYVTGQTLVVNGGRTLQL